MRRLVLQAAHLERILARELGAQEEDLRRVIHPQQQGDQRAGGAEAVRGAAVADVQANAEFAEREHRSRAQGANGDVVPGQLDTRQQLVDHPEQGGDDQEADGPGDPAHDHGGFLPHAADILFDDGQRRADDQRHHQQEAQHQDQAEGEQAGAHQVPDAGFLRRRHIPDLVQAVFQFGKHGGRADQQQHGGDNGRKAPAFLVLRPGQDGLDRLRPLRPHQAAQLVQELALGGFGAVEEAGDGDDQHQHRRQREQGIEGQRRALARGAMIEPFHYRAAHHVDQLTRIRQPFFDSHESSKLKRGPQPP